MISPESWVCRLPGGKPARCCDASSLLDDADQHEKDDGADRRMDNGGKNAAADADAEIGKQYAGDDGADNADDNISDQAEAETGNDQACKPAGNGADNKKDNNALAR
jgi:hypothetical protein